MIKHLNYFYKQNSLLTTTQRITCRQDFLLGIKSQHYTHIPQPKWFSVPGKLCPSHEMFPSSALL